MIRLFDGKLEVLLDSNNGCLRKLTDMVSGAILADSEVTQPFILEYDQNKFGSDYTEFTYNTQDESAVNMQWQVEQGIVVSSQVLLQEGKLVFTAAVQNNTEKSLSSLEYPLLDGFGAICEGNDYLAHAYATGYLVHDPVTSFANDNDGMRHMPYPEAFSGATMQFFTYYSQGLTGLCFAALDGDCHQKWLNFYKNNGKLRASQIFGYEDIGAGKPLTADWQFVVQLTSGDGWYEAADMYRRWALEQKWCAKGKLAALGNDQKADWLLEEMGAATFGINACHDRTRWLRQYSQDIGKPIFHILGPDWPKVDQNYCGSLPGGYDDWFPTRFSHDNIEQMRKQGDRFAPFEFDFLLSDSKADSCKIKASLQKWPEIPKARDGYTFTMLCPLCDYTKELHRERDRRVVRESGCDSMYYDISANNIIKTCMSEKHGHTIGAGRAMTDAYRDIYDDTKTSISNDVGHYFPLGTEMINETFIDRLDYYQARAFAQPCSSLETWPFRALLKAGKAEMIPMFHYVYSEYAPLRLDGWGKLTDEGGDQVWHTIAKTYLWGGLFEINSEYSPMEVLDGVENSSDEHYCKLDRRGYDYRPEIAAYIAKFAALRTGRYNPFLAYGRMLRAPDIGCRRILRTWYQYNHGNDASEQNDRGIIELDSVIAASYRYGDEIVVFIANTTAFSQHIDTSRLLPSGTKRGNICPDYADDTSAVHPLPTGGISLTRLDPYQISVITYQV